MEAITDPAALAARFVELADRGAWADIEALFAPSLRAVVSADAVRAGWTTEADAARRSRRARRPADRGDRRAV